MLGRAEPVRLALLELGLSWEEPWQSDPALKSIDACLAEIERMRASLPQPVFGLPVLEHRTHACTGQAAERKEESARGSAGDVFWIGQSANDRITAHCARPLLRF